MFANAKRRSRARHELNRIGVNLNQMARALNSRAVSSPAETQAAVERPGANGRRAGHSSRGGRAAGASAGGAALDGGLPAPPGAGAAGADGGGAAASTNRSSVRVIPVWMSGQQQFLPSGLTSPNIVVASVRVGDLQNAELKFLCVGWSLLTQQLPKFLVSAVTRR